jgi:hypothetical protein
MPNETKTYLGDGVYAELEQGMIKLTTEDGINTTNTIYLDDGVYNTLTRWVGNLINKSLP